MSNVLTTVQLISDKLVGVDPAPGRLKLYVIGGMQKMVWVMRLQ